MDKGYLDALRLEIQRVIEQRINASPEVEAAVSDTINTCGDIEGMVVDLRQHGIATTVTLGAFVHFTEIGPNGDRQITPAQETVMDNDCQTRFSRFISSLGMSDPEETE